MFDYGSQTYYAAQDDFNAPARQAVFLLSQDAKEKLIKEWKRMSRLIDRETDDEILNQYTLVVVAGVVAKAWIAQKRYHPPERSDNESFDLGAYFK